jgi:hypothetical protein
MAIRVGVSGVTTKKVAVTGSNTLVKKINVGTPVRRVVSGQKSLAGLTDVDLTAKQDGSVLVYNTSSEKWKATLDLEKQNINGGSY